MKTQSSWGIPWRFAPAPFCALPAPTCCLNCNFHRHDRLNHSLALLAGLAVAITITRFGHPDPEHHLASITCDRGKPLRVLLFAHDLKPGAKAPSAPKPAPTANSPPSAA
jgi:hypothetical protein